MQCTSTREVVERVVRALIVFLLLQATEACVGIKL